MSEITEKRTLTRAGKWGIVIAAVIALAGFLNEGKKTDAQADVIQKAASEAAKSPELKAKETAEKDKREVARVVAVMQTKALKNSMKDPESFTLNSLIILPSGHGCINYRAKNSFGAIFPGSAVILPTGKVLVEEKDKNTFVKSWNTNCTKTGGENLTRFAITQL